MTEDKIKILQVLYNSEINCSISWFYDEGVIAKLGDEYNGYSDEMLCPTVEKAIDWLWETAKIRYPYFGKHSSEIMGLHVDLDNK